MCEKCGQTPMPYIDPKYTQKRYEKDMLFSGIVNLSMNAIGAGISVWNANKSDDEDSEVSTEVDDKYKLPEESEEVTDNDSKDARESVENILGKDNFSNLSNDMQKDILNKYSVYKDVLKLEGTSLNDRVKTYVKALQAHQVELKMGAYNEKLFEETLKKVAVNPENPTEEELELVKTKVLQKKQECDIKIEDSDIETQALQNDQNFEKHLLAVKARGQGYVDMYDKNNNGVISFEEFKALEELDSGKVLNPEEAEARRIFFNRIDKDNDGIEAHEMASHLYAMSRMHDKSEEGAPNSANDITFGEWLDSQQILNNENVSTRYNSIYNMLYEEIKPKK